MGNCSCSSKSRNALNCFGNKHAKKSKQTKNKTSDVLPEDLHASSGQECQPGQTFRPIVFFDIAALMIDPLVLSFVLRYG